MLGKAGSGLLGSAYARLRVLILPLREIDEALPRAGTILDLGCGQGVVAAYLGRLTSRKVIGIDGDSARVERGNASIGLPNVRLEVGDIRTACLEGLDGALLSDVLHHLAPDDQLALLGRIHAGLEPGGVFVLKEIDRGELVRSRLSLLWDRLLYPRDRIHYRSRGEMESILAGLGFTVGVSRPSRLFPGSTTLYVCRKQ